MTEQPISPRERCGNWSPAIGLGERTECVLRPGHSGSHADDRGARWATEAASARESAEQGAEAVREGESRERPPGGRTAFPTVQGRCPACRGASLFLGAGGHVTCSRLDCPNPVAVDDMLHGEQPEPDTEATEVAEPDSRDEGHPEPPDEDDNSALPVRPDPRQPAYDAVFAYIRDLGQYLPPDPVHRNAIIWRAVHAALDATPVGRCVSSHCVEGDHILIIDGPPAHNGPTVREAAADDRAYWERKDAGETP